MTQQEGPAALHPPVPASSTCDTTSTQPRTPDSSVPVGQGWPGSLSDAELKKLVAVLDAAVAAHYEVPLPAAEYDDLLTATVTARLALRRRKARSQIKTAQELLRATGWRVAS